MSERNPDAAYEERRKILDALDLPDYLQPLQNHYWDKRREFLKLEDACLTMVESCLELDAQRGQPGG